MEKVSLIILNANVIQSIIAKATTVTIPKNVLRFSLLQDHFPSVIVFMELSNSLISPRIPLNYCVSILMNVPLELTLARLLQRVSFLFLQVMSRNSHVFVKRVSYSMRRLIHVYLRWENVVDQTNCKCEKVARRSVLYPVYTDLYCIGRYLQSDDRRN